MVYAIGTTCYLTALGLGFSLPDRPWASALWPLIVLVGAGGAIPTTPAAVSCGGLGVAPWVPAARDLGFDVYVVTYRDPNTYTQRQAFGLIVLIQRLQSEGRITPAADVAIVGISWGGLISRYALQYMETHGPAHDVDLWLTGDSPLQGAYVPIAIQHVAQYFADDFGVRAAAEASRDVRMKVRRVGMAASAPWCGDGEGRCDEKFRTAT